jgi:hypothetical protein
VKNNRNLKPRQTEHHFGLREITNSEIGCFCITIDSGEPNGMPDFFCITIDSGEPNGMPDFFCPAGQSLTNTVYICIMQSTAEQQNSHSGTKDVPLDSV